MIEHALVLGDFEMRRQRCSDQLLRAKLWCWRA